MGAITVQLPTLRALFPRARAEILEGLLAALRPAGSLHNAGVTANTRRLEFFLAKTAVETGGLTVFLENLNYTSWANLKRVPGWSRRFPTEAAARPYIRNPKALAIKVYGGRMGNAAAPSEDGWTFRGRGPLQLTGKDNYRRIGQLVGLDLVGNPDLAAHPVHMWRISADYWRRHNCNTFADRNDLEGLVRHVGGGPTNMRHHWDWLRKAERELARGRGVTPAPANPKPLESSRTVGGGGTAAGGGAVIVAERVNEAVQQGQRGIEHISAWTWAGIAIGVLIVIGGLVTLWARWSDAGRPVPAWCPAWLRRLVGGQVMRVERPPAAELEEGGA